MVGERKRYKLLIGEQDLQLQAHYRRYFPEKVFDKRLVENNMQAINTYGSWHPQAIVLDDDLPYRNVFSLVKEVRQVNDDPNTIIVVTTKLWSKNKEYDLLDMGVQKVLSVPFNVGGLAHALVASAGGGPEAFVAGVGDLTRLKLLICEDDQRVVDLYDKYIPSGAFEKKVAGNGREAFDLYGKWKPDLIILDIMMPEGNGLELLDRIRNVMKDKTTSIVMATSKGDKEIILKCAKYAVQGYLVKPFNLKTLNNDLLEYYRKHRAQLAAKTKA